MDQEAGEFREKARLNLRPYLRAGMLPVVWLAALLLILVDSSQPKTQAGTDAPATAPGETVEVKRVIDGDTIELANGERVRYLGVDAPEMRRKIRGRWVERPEPYAAEAYAVNRRLVEGRRVRLELDQETRDRYHRLLAYVFVNDRLVNADLISSGFVQVRLHPPNLRYADLFMKLQADALARHRGLWALEGRKSTP